MNIFENEGVSILPDHVVKGRAVRCAELDLDFVTLKPIPVGAAVNVCYHHAVGDYVRTVIGVRAPFAKGEQEKIRKAQEARKNVPLPVA